MRTRTVPLRLALCLVGVGLVVLGASALRPSAAATTAAAPPPPSVTADAAARVIDGHDLAGALEEAGVELPDGSSVYAAVVVEGSGGLVYEEFEAGDGARAEDFWPASSVKVLAAEGALAYLAELGFTGAATITMGRDTFTVADVYREAIADSSNEAYDTLVRIAGVDWLNTRFLTADNGFPATVIQRSIEPAVEDVLDGDVAVYNKPGYVPGDACVDVAVLTARRPTSATCSGSPPPMTAGPALPS